MEIWLLGYEVTDTVVVITKSKRVQFFTSAKKALFLAPLKKVLPASLNSPWSYHRF